MHISNQNLPEKLQSYVWKIAKRLCLLVFSDVKNRNWIYSVQPKVSIRVDGATELGVYVAVNQRQSWCPEIAERSQPQLLIGWCRCPTRWPRRPESRPLAELSIASAHGHHNVRGAFNVLFLRVQAVQEIIRRNNVGLRSFSNQPMSRNTNIKLEMSTPPILMLAWPLVSG